MTMSLGLSLHSIMICCCHLNQKQYVCHRVRTSRMRLHLCDPQKVQISVHLFVHSTSELSYPPSLRRIACHLMSRQWSKQHLCALLRVPVLIFPFLHSILE